MSRHRLLAALEIALVVLFLVRLWRFFVELPIASLYQQDYEEGNILNALVRILHGATPYPDPHALPNMLNNYGPAAYYLLVIPVKWFGVAFVYPRAMILLATIVIALLIGVALKRRTGSMAVAAVFALVFLTIPNVRDWMWVLRVDLLGIAFTIAGLVAFSHKVEPAVVPSEDSRIRVEEPAAVIVSGVLFAIGALVKPTLVAAPAACFFALIARRRYRTAAMLTAVTAAVFAMVMGAFVLVTRGAVLIDIFLSHPDPFSWRVYTQGLTEMMTTSWPFVVLAVVAIARDLARRRFSPEVLWLLLATATAITAGKVGSNRNHFLEWNAALCLAAGIGFLELTRLASARVAIVTSALAIGAAALVAAYPPPYPASSGPGRECTQAYAWVRTEAGPHLLAENIGSLVLANKKVWVSNPFVLAQLVEHAGWSDAALVDMVRQRGFDAINMGMDYPAIPSIFASGAERFSPAVLHAIAENYQARPGFQCRDMQVLYIPKPAIQSK